ncbi:MAG: hypothetical protein KBG91_07460 [Syntrophomonadaceae bacterium]|nr:hypothetical protein [Syntrophomonadaceae bacterium]NLX01787.1 hypothetical protein [Syntrophomonadaceae bacterium]
MKKKWGKGDPVNLSDLLRITPVANEIMQLSEELEMSTTDVMWIVAQIIDNGQEVNSAQHAQPVNEDDLFDDDWDDIDLENLEEDMDQAMYLVNVRINGGGRFPEIGFKAGINDREDIAYFFDMVLEMLEKLD